MSVSPDWDAYGDGALEPSESASQAIRDVLAERVRQITEEGWSHAHDDREHYNGELALAAAAYCAGAQGFYGLANQLWPWDGPIKQKSKRRDLVRASALIIAQIELMDRIDPPRALTP